MHESASSSPVADTISVALRHIQHFPDALDTCATLRIATGESLFTSAETVRTASQVATR
jgi:hypothetical protein